MHPILSWFFLVAVLARMATLALSRRNERALRAAGAREHGAGVSNALAGLHTFFYVGCALEGLVRGTSVDGISLVGMAVWGFAMAVLTTVIATLGPQWTVRLLVAPDHRLHRGWLFRTFRHPNYFLNLAPELIGLGLALHAWVTLVVLLPPYALFLRKRIEEEERVMGERFPEYGGEV
ncbi:MAG: isoprenylcysteine carboxyl methyltransferase family protein [Gemmatimonadetes bacterium]|nr:isoprenylcysteine carboxyl methyltransferase family protein [Gemmatimonadota bacterium]